MVNLQNVPRTHLSAFPCAISPLGESSRRSFREGLSSTAAAVSLLLPSVAEPLVLLLLAATAASCCCCWPLLFVEDESASPSPASCQMPPFPLVNFLRSPPPLLLHNPMRSSPSPLSGMNDIVLPAPPSPPPVADQRASSDSCVKYRLPIEDSRTRKSFHVCESCSHGCTRLLSTV